MKTVLVIGCLIIACYGQDRAPDLVDGDTNRDIEQLKEERAPDLQDEDKGEIRVRQIKDLPARKKAVGKNPGDEEGVNRITGGTDADYGEYPWVVSLYFRGSFFCGGSILNRNTILTAAHCITGNINRPYDIQVRAGDWRMTQKDDYEQRRRVRRVIKHPRYTTVDSKDIAILKLKGKLTYTDYVKTIKLPSPTKEDELTTIGNCVNTGYGSIISPGSQTPEKLQEAPSNLGGRAYCRARSWYEFYAVFDKFKVCTIDDGKGPCFGDSGGGLVCYDGDSVPYAIGILSFGSENCWEGFNVWTRTSRFLKWIAKYT